MTALPLSNPYGLLYELRKLLETALADVPVAVTPPVSADSPAHTPPKVLVGALPARTATGEGPKPPFVLLQVMGGRDNEHCHEVTVALRVALFGGDPEGAEADLHVVISAMRLALLQLPGHATPSGAWRLDTGNGLPWERPDTQGSPFVEAYMTTVWQTRAGIAAAYH